MGDLIIFLWFLGHIVTLIFFYWLGYKWARDNPDKIFMENFFEIEKENDQL